jgi:predicted aspartyl protease
VQTTSDCAQPDDSAWYKNKRLRTENNIQDMDNPNNWLLDTGASSHIVSNIELYDEFTRIPNSDVTIQLGDNRRYPVHVQGTIKLCTEVNNKKREIILTNVAYCPEMKKNLISLSTISMDYGKINITMDNGKGCIYDCEKQPIMNFETRNMLWFHAIQLW